MNDRPIMGARPLTLCQSTLPVRAGDNLQRSRQDGGISKDAAGMFLKIQLIKCAALQADEPV